VAASSLAPAQLLVSDDGSTSESQSATRAVVAQFPGASYLAGPRRGLSANRNSCLRAIAADLVVFVDDDVVLDPRFLEMGLSRFQQEQLARGTDRIVLTGHEVRPDGAYYPSTLNFLGFYRPGDPGAGKINATCINSTFFPAALFREATFDERILFGAEERDISLHALSRGYQLVYAPGLRNFHYPSPINRDIYKRNAVVSRVYFGLKRYWLYEPSLARFAAFLLYAPLNAAGSRLKRGRFAEAWDTMRACLDGWWQFRAHLASRSAPHA
jgi:glycosyltransferase involved in cell wall biosynthesis